MHYATIFEGEECEVEVLEVSPGNYDVIISATGGHEGDGEHIRVNARRVKNTTWSFIIDDHAYNIEFEQDPTQESKSENLLLRGETLAIEVLDLRNLRLRASQALSDGDSGPAEIKSPMPGKIVAVLVEEGQEVSEGTGLVVIEAMKMENELKAPKAGTVRHLDLQEGFSVEGGTVLCVVE